MKPLIIERKSNSSPLSLKVGLANTDELRMQGLMFRKELSEKDGMYFIFDTDGQIPFWMKNTYIPLDIIFINSKNEIIDIAEQTTPLSEAIIPSQMPYRYVLEVNAGFTKKYNIKIGDKVFLK